MNDYSAEQPQAAAFTPEQMAQLLFSVKAVMAQQQVLADFPDGIVKFCHLLDAGHQVISMYDQQVSSVRREN